MSYLKGAVIFLSGIGVGGVASYLYFKNKYDEREEEIIELKEHYNKKLLEGVELSKVDNIIKEQKYVPYDKMDDIEIKDIIVEKEKEAGVTDNPKEDYPEEAFLIDENDYSERELYFDKVELDYYVEDEALVDEADEITDIDSTVGYDIISKFVDDENEGTIYVRNPKTNTDYIVNKRFGKYSDIVGLGGDDTDE